MTIGLVRVVSEGAALPRGYGRAWVNAPARTATCAPIGLHWVLGIARALYHVLRVGVGPSVLDRAYSAGWQHGVDTGRLIRAAVLHDVEQRAKTAGARARVCERLASVETK